MNDKSNQFLLLSHFLLAIRKMSKNKAYERICFLSISVKVVVLPSGHNRWFVYDTL